MVNVNAMLLNFCGYYYFFNFSCEIHRETEERVMDFVSPNAWSLRLWNKKQKLHSDRKR